MQGLGLSEPFQYSASGASDDQAFALEAGIDCQRQEGDLSDVELDERTQKGRVCSHVAVIRSTQTALCHKSLQLPCSQIALSSIHRSLNDSDPAVRSRALLSFGCMVQPGDNAALETIEGYCRDRDAGVRQAALKALQHASGKHLDGLRFDDNIEVDGGFIASHLEGRRQPVKPVPPEPEKLWVFESMTAFLRSFAIMCQSEGMWEPCAVDDQTKLDHSDVLIVEEGNEHRPSYYYED